MAKSIIDKLHSDDERKMAKPSLRMKSKSSTSFWPRGSPDHHWFHSPMLDDAH